MWRKFAITVSAVLCLFTTTAVANAAAQTAADAVVAATESAYPPPAATITVNQATACADERIHVTGSGFAAGETVLITATVVGQGQGLRRMDVPGIPSSVVADGTGAFTLSFTMPAGSVAIETLGATSGTVGSVVVSLCGGPTTPVPTSAAPPVGPLPDTGAGFDLTSGLVIGFGAVLIGLALAIYGGRDLYRSRRTRRVAH